MRRSIVIVAAIGLITAISLTPAAVTAAETSSKPVKVFILVGQSNMEGHAQTRTLQAIAKDPKTADLYKAMVDAEGKPVVCDNVWISYAYGDFGGNPVGKKAGKLTAGWGSQHHVGTGKIGPEFTFGIYMQKLLDEPIVLIKTAWGGKSLMVDFRPPSAGALPDTTNEKTKEAAGKAYNSMMQHVKEVLADTKSVYPYYDSNAGYELAGFVWFQGFNDLVGSYPPVDPAQGRKGVKDYSEYSRLLSCFIRDVRKDLSAPNLPFVIGVIGVGGESTNENTVAFRNAMAAPAGAEELKGRVVNVFTEKYWPTEIDAVLAKANAAREEFAAREKELKVLSNSGEEGKNQAKLESAKLEAEKRAKIEKTLTPDELFLLDNGISNAGFHYHGSAKFFAQVGKAFAEALLPFQKQK